MAKRSGPTVTTLQALAVASQFGITLAVSVVLGVFAGQWLDSRLNTGFIFTLTGVVIGLVGSATSTARLYRTLLRKSASDTDAQTTESTPMTDDGEHDG